MPPSRPGLWNPWTWIVTYWLYFAHFFFFTTLAVRTGRTSLWSLYLWGVLYGLYESWITKVIWYGYGGDGKLVLGHIGPYGLGELSMVFIFHPVMSFLLPLAVACLLCPPLRRFFPDLAWFTGRSRGTRVVRAYLVFSLAPIVGMNSGGPANLALNVVFILGLLLILSGLARTGLAASDGRSIVAFGQWGFAGLCLYLALLYGFMYFKLRPEGLPSVHVQLLTFVFYALAILGLRLHRPREPLPVAVVDVEPRELRPSRSFSGLPKHPVAVVDVEPRELRLAMAVFAWVIGLGFIFSFVPRQPLIFVPFVLNSVVWTFLGFLLTSIALWQGVREFRNPWAGSQGPDHESRGSREEKSAAQKNALDADPMWDGDLDG